METQFEVIVGADLTQNTAWVNDKRALQNLRTAERTALVEIYNETHGLIVGVGKSCCRKSKPACDTWPLRKFLLAK